MTKNNKKIIQNKKAQMSQSEITVLVIIIIILIFIGFSVFFSKAKYFKEVVLG